MDNNNDQDDLDDKLIDATVLVATVVIILYAKPSFNKTPLHTSSLSGLGWVPELLNGHPECIQCELGVHKHVFEGLVSEHIKLDHGNS